MAWDHLNINKPHLVYIILGGFTSLFMLCSSIIKERLYIGEATVATIVGIIFGPHAANLINPMEWGNTDQITLEFSRIVLVVQCFAVGVELPKLYMNRHWKSVSILLVPVMGFGWIMTTLFIWWMFHDRLSFLGSLCVAACVTATDPVLASSVVGKGKFAKRVPKHLRDLLSAESGCNDGMAFPFIYLALYLIHYNSNAKQVTYHWLCYTILYECIFGAVYGVIVGYLARRAIRYADEHDLIDRESFLVFYFVLALFCAGSGSILGIDDLLVGFACGVGFSNDGWFQEKTEESHVSNVIDLLINLAFFVYFGTIIPWPQYNDAAIGTSAWRLVVVAIFVVLFRRIPIMLMFKPIIKDIKTWREALFAGHFGPIGVGAIFVAIMARAELEGSGSTPLAESDIPSNAEHLNIINLVWPITTFLVITSILVHGSSVAVFTLGRHINTLTLTFSFTTAVEEGPTWMERLPRISSRSKSTQSLGRADSDAETLDEKTGRGAISPRNIPRNFLRRQREEDVPSRSSSRAGRRRRHWDTGIGPGGPISQSAIMPASRLRPTVVDGPDQSPDIADQALSSDSEIMSPATASPAEPQEEIYREGSNIIIEDEEGNVLSVRKSQGRTEAEEEKAAVREATELLEEKDIQHGVAMTEHPEEKSPLNERGPQRPTVGDRRGSSSWWKTRMENISTNRRVSETAPSSSQVPIRRGPARAYTFGNTVIVEDEDGEVIKQYQLPSNKGPSPSKSGTDGIFQRVGHYLGTRDGPATVGKARDASVVVPPEDQRPNMEQADTDDDTIRFTLAAGGPRLRKEEFINELQKMDTRSRARVAELISETQNALQREDASSGRRLSTSTPAVEDLPRQNRPAVGTTMDYSRSHSSSELQPIKTTETIPGVAVADTLAHFAFERGGRETAAQRRRRQFEGEIRPSTADDSDSSPPPPIRRESVNRRESVGRRESTARRESISRGQTISAGNIPEASAPSYMEEKETEAEKRRRQAALGLTKEEDSSDDEDDGTGFREYNPNSTTRGDAPTRSMAGSSSRNAATRTSVRFENTPEESPRNSSMRLRWGEDVGRKP
jgi:sodium/hydrogen antiporter